MGFWGKSAQASRTEHSQLIKKAINARNHGAKAVLIINGKLGDGEEDQLTRFGSVRGPENAGILFVQVQNDAAQEWFAAAGTSLAEVPNETNTHTHPTHLPFPPHTP